MKRKEPATGAGPNYRNPWNPQLRNHVGVQRVGVVVQEAPRTLGLASEIISIINDHALLSLEAPVVRVTGFDTVFPLAKLENYYLPNAKRIVKGIEWVLNY